MAEQICEKCNHLCHCESRCFSHEDCSCNKCGCGSRAEDLSFENNGVVIDDTNDCEGCQ